MIYNNVLYVFFEQIDAQHPGYVYMKYKVSTDGVNFTEYSLPDFPDYIETQPRFSVHPTYGILLSTDVLDYEFQTKPAFINVMALDPLTFQANAVQELFPPQGYNANLGTEISEKNVVFSAGNDGFSPRVFISQCN